ncbi:malate dehydrogenase chloroplastic-like [Prunus yedoensis var. nudiflora]|uniref:malate dehydrogenase n=1 Tax=Prunus yedoensis var. nudiflora TaxID=2094558 RepID=A0A314ZGP9_PRUYE|nr:malate dehydrogenase chloroplastic-like [Prunus yedoensis var. nudiflora]
MDEKLNVALGWLREYTTMTNKIENLVHCLEVVSPKLTQMETSIETVPAEEVAAAIDAFKSAAKDAKQVGDALNMSESFREICLENLLEFEEVCINTIFEMRTLVHLKLEYEWKVAIFIRLDCNEIVRKGQSLAMPTSSHASSYKVALLGAVGEIGEPLALLIKMSPWVSALHLYDTKDVKGVGDDLIRGYNPKMEGRDPGKHLDQKRQRFTYLTSNSKKSYFIKEAWEESKRKKMATFHSYSSFRWTSVRISNIVLMHTSSNSRRFSK